MKIGQKGARKYCNIFKKRLLVNKLLTTTVRFSNSVIFLKTCAAFIFQTFEFITVSCQ